MDQLIINYQKQIKLNYIVIRFLVDFIVLYKYYIKDIIHFKDSSNAIFYCILKCIFKI